MPRHKMVIVARKDQVLKVPNAALRFTPPKSERTNGQSSGSGGNRPDAGSKAALSVVTRGDAMTVSKPVWKVGPSGDPEAIPIQPGISDGSATEVVSGELKESDTVIVGIELPEGERIPHALPPGFGSGQRRPSPRDRGL